MKLLWALCLALLLLLMPVHAAHAQRTPEDAAALLALAVQERGVVALADFTHPDELKRLRDQIEPAMLDTSGAGTDLIAGFFGPTASPASVAAAADIDFLRGFLRLVDQHMQSNEVVFGQFNIIGTVKEGAVVHVLIRNTATTGPLHLTQLDVLSARRDQRSWKFLVPAKVEGIIQALRVQATEAGASSPSMPEG